MPVLGNEAVNQPAFKVFQSNKVVYILATTESRTPHRNVTDAEQKRCGSQSGDKQEDIDP